MASIHDIVNKACLDFFNKLRRNAYVTPKSFLSFVNGFRQIYTDKVSFVGRLAETLNNGLSKLIQAEQDVARMKVELVGKEKHLAVKADELAVLLEEIKANTAIAETVKAEVQAVKDDLAEKAAVIDGQKREAEADLAAAEPALQEAIAALDKIKSSDIASLKKLAKPPNLIMRIMDSVLILRQFNVVPVSVDPEFDGSTEKTFKRISASWSASQSMMNDSAFLQSLFTFPKDNINDETCELLEPYFNYPDFNAQAAANVGGFVVGLCQWAMAMVKYHEVEKNVKPKRMAVAEALQKLEIAERDLAKAQAELDQKQAELDEITAKYEAALADKKRLEADLDMTKRKMDSANALINGLSTEKVRWTQQSGEFKDTIRRLIGDSALSMAFLSYLGPFNQEFRQNLFQVWQEELHLSKVPFTKKLAITRFLADENTVGEWNLQGLPTDELSTQNGILVTSAPRYPLLIDPQGQGRAWLKMKEGRNNLRVTNLNDEKHFRLYLEECLESGYPLLLENIEDELDPMLDPVLEKNWGTGKRKRVKLGDKEIGVQASFMMYLTTKLPNPHYTPEISAKTTIVNFTVTMQGLEDQLLGRVILKEKKELEDKRVKLLEDVNAYKRRGKELEDDLLARLSNAQGNLLDDITLIDVLNDTKRTAEEIAEKISTAKLTEETINVAREEFRPVAARGSILYFLVADMTNVSNMYQTSLGQFLKKFDEALENSEKSLVTVKRIANIIEYSTFYIFQYVQRGLFESHKMVFGLLMALKIDMQAHRISANEFNVFIKGGAALDISTARKNPSPWIPNDSWLNIVALTEITTFRSLPDQIERNEKKWKEWYDYEDPENHELPDGYESQMDQFGRLLLVRCFRPDRTILAAVKYILQALGEAFVNPRSYELTDILTESDPRTPILFLLSLGSDPTESIYALGKKMKTIPQGVSMGQGQEVIARALISKAITEGGWVLLQNCHLGLKFLSELEVTLSTLEPGREHPGFRVWVTAEPHPKFPIGLLQMSIKLTNEPPQGVKAGLRRSYAWLNQDKLEVIDRPQWRQILYAMCFLHTTVQERRKYGPLGWNIPYEFNQSDLSASIQFLQKFLYAADPKKPITWSTIRYMICEVMYGGRITDDFDRQLMTTYGQVWMDNHLFTPEYNFYPGYSVPDKARIEDYRSYIEALPLVDTPEIMGLHPNADITYRQNESAKVLSVILSIQPKESGGSGGETREDAVLRIVVDLLSKLPKDFDKIYVAAQIRQQGGFLPLNIFLKQEIDRMQAVIALLRKSLSDLKLAIAGTIIMSETLAGILNALYDARVPKVWEALSWPSKTLGFWFADVIKRSEQYTSWLDEGRPKVFWLAGFFNPQGFLTAMRQETTRANKGWSLDSVIINTEVTKYEKDDVKNRPEDGVYIYGLFLDGAAWDKKNMKLIEAPPKVLNWSLPVVHVTAINTLKKMAELYPCPVYRTPQRTDLNYIFSVTLPSNKTPSHWTLRGVALLCSTV
eukprot:GILK01006251.1.p1 GENE.GILK01006251.1~~GILK01006251.1.p1  ORF type:complete len:1675 (+),score=351.95 GILK01006251.1:567-5027(+)